METGRREYRMVGTDQSPIPEGEPVFILRAQDDLAEVTVRVYALLAAKAGRWAVERSAVESAEAMAAWPTKKLPDL